MITNERLLESLGIVARGSGPQADLLAVFAGNDTISVELDLVQPAGAGWGSICERRLARQDEAGRLGTGSDRAGKRAKAYATVDREGIGSGREQACRSEIGRDYESLSRSTILGGCRSERRIHLSV